MAEEDTSFTAIGPTVVAFEAGPFSEGDWPAIGVGVFGSTCGVHGVGGSVLITALGSQDDITRTPAPPGVGVNGLGESEDVRGKGPTGIHGVGDAIGVFGEGPLGVSGLGVAAGAFEAPGVSGIGSPGVRGPSGAVGAGVGVEGRGGIGVDGDGADTGVLGKGQVAGVRGNSSDGCGVIGASGSNRAGLFQTQLRHRPPQMADHVTRANEVAPQICLLAPQLDTTKVEDVLPRAGIAGDLLAVIPLGSRLHRQGLPAQLWFCVRTGSNEPGLAGATWAPIQLGGTVVVP
jgi:hypothetical protein